jgi:hypothetical protein
MPIEFINDPEEWERLTGSRGSWVIESAPRRRKRRWAFLCPNCYATLRVQQAGVFQCDSCGKIFKDARAEPPLVPGNIP